MGSPSCKIFQPTRQRRWAVAQNGRLIAQPRREMTQSTRPSLGARQRSSEGCVVGRRPVDRSSGSAHQPQVDRQLPTMVRPVHERVPNGHVPRLLADDLARDEQAPFGTGNFSGCRVFYLGIEWNVLETSELGMAKRVQFLSVAGGGEPRIPLGD